MTDLPRLCARLDACAPALAIVPFAAPGAPRQLRFQAPGGAVGMLDFSKSDSAAEAALVLKSVKGPASRMPRAAPFGSTGVAASDADD